MKRKVPPIPKDMKKYPIWVNITIPLTKAEMRGYVGKKCKEFDPRCDCCKAWQTWLKTGKIRTLVERRKDVLLIEEEK